LRELTIEFFIVFTFLDLVRYPVAVVTVVACARTVPSVNVVAFALTLDRTFAVAVAFTCTSTLADIPLFLGAGTTPPTEPAIEPSKTIFAIKL
jgi:hypothetical protein